MGVQHIPRYEFWYKQSIFYTGARCLTFSKSFSALAFNSINSPFVFDTSAHRAEATV
jgi:hypothetical protein